MKILEQRYEILDTVIGESVDKLWDTIGLLLDAFSETECADYLKNSGYGPSAREMLWYCYVVQSESSSS